jgi:CheY-like chemotaxis protein
MNALGQLAGGIAHDFNNQLAGIMGYTELIKSVSDDKSVLKYADSVISSCNSAAALIRQLLFFARKGSLTSLPVDMHQVLKKVLSIIRRSIDRKIALSASFEAENRKVMGDESQLQNVFLNLAINARDAMPRGGKLEISTINKIFDGTPTGEKTDLSFPGRYIEISVSDTGEGIPESIRHRIFEPFFTTKDAGRGTGLGLSAVYGTVAGHNGTVSFTTEEGKGTVFRVLLPVSSAALPEKKGEEPAPVSGSGRYSILVVDDEELLKELLVSILEKEKHRITAFSGAREALSFFETNWKAIDLVILDMVMPEMDGAELFGKMKELNPSVRAILSSGYSFEYEYESLEGLGIAGFIQKPYSARVLLEKVREVMSGT